ncbi:GNAT family N-acetyltransferase [Pedosphaera parvula]|uniref:GCN5-related N-acetyltransferase n=1 Tax=Pedosphaera parvula (strain Ellin514) TaxID=320771 RepID=B9XIJ2_PEDPL|nr:GNAT family N-acetyltransferase [Pedosphaera parvula]EEF60255.1 GCN5-related N-acetyltransferase [Pedosphaera parvula Ellin514]
MQVIRCDASFSEPILNIFNDAILNSTALYDYKPRTLENMATWFDLKTKGNFPVIGLVTDAGELMGFGTYGTFRGFAGYKYTVEHSIYVDAKFRGQGLGKRLLQEIISAAQAQDYHVLIGVVDSANSASIALHKKFGFTHAGTIRQAGFKFNRWLDVDFYQLVLPTPGIPVES